MAKRNNGNKCVDKIIAEQQRLETEDRLLMLRVRVRLLEEALAWCSAANNFQPGENARTGWLKICEPLLNSIE